jgi:hypothetical protein
MSDNLCAVCARIVVNDERPLGWRTPRSKEPHHQNMLELKTCAEQNGCPLCRLFLAAINEDFQFQYPNRNFEDYLNNQGGIYRTLAGSPTLSYDVNLVTEDKNGPDQINWGESEQTLNIYSNGRGAILGRLSIFIEAGIIQPSRPPRLEFVRSLSTNLT